MAPSESSNKAALVIGVGVATVALGGLGAAVGAALILASNKGNWPKLTLPWENTTPPPLSVAEWREVFDTPGGSADPKASRFEAALERVRQGGVEPSLRDSVWPFLLGVDSPTQSAEDRKASRQVRRVQYESLRERCAELSFAANNRDTAVGSPVATPATDATGAVSLKHKPLASGRDEVSAFGEAQRIIWLDAVRTDPQAPAEVSWELVDDDGLEESAATSIALASGKLAGTDWMNNRQRQRAAHLASILEAYAAHDTEIGYCQGMSDLLSPFLTVFKDAAEAFWCFEHFMQQGVRNNFRIDQEGIHTQLAILGRILAFADPPLWKHFETVGASNCLFAYRMVVVLLRREMPFEQTLLLYEIMWAEARTVDINDGKVIRNATERTPFTLPRIENKVTATRDFHLYFIAAILLSHKRVFLTKCVELDDVLRECNALAGKFEFFPVLRHARHLVATLDGTV
eukprot:jgi/Chlat1/5363/Chrsp35S08986